MTQISQDLKNKHLFFYFLWSLIITRLQERTRLAITKFLDTGLNIGRQIVSEKNSNKRLWTSESGKKN